MNRLVAGPMALVAVAALSVGSAIAVPSNPITGDVGLIGSVSGKCMFTSSNVILDIGEMVVVSGSGAGVGHFDPTRLNSKTAVLTGWCNGTAATMTVQANPMLNSSLPTPPAGFTNRVDYTATAQVTPAGGPVSVSDDTVSAGASAPKPVTSFSGDIDVAFSNAAAVDNDLLVAGAYEGSVVVTLSPST